MNRKKNLTNIHKWPLDVSPVHGWLVSTCFVTERRKCLTSQIYLSVMSVWSFVFDPISFCPVMVALFAPGRNLTHRYFPGLLHYIRLQTYLLQSVHIIKRARRHSNHVFINGTRNTSMKTWLDCIVSGVWPTDFTVFKQKGVTTSDLQTLPPRPNRRRLRGERTDYSPAEKGHRSVPEGRMYQRKDYRRISL